MTKPDKLEQLAQMIPIWGRELGFQEVGISDIDLQEQEGKTQTVAWTKRYQGDMQWMGEHGNKRSRPEELLPGTRRVISARMNYLPPSTEPIRVLKDSNKAYVSRYAFRA